jgi:intracellular sulfur oxidation DsrE/DsrF family protein
MRTLAALLAGLLATMAPIAMVHAADQAAPVVQSPVRVVYHMDRDLDQIIHGIRNIKNHLAADPTAQIVVVVYGRAVGSLKQGTETEGGYPLDVMIEEIQARGVRFEVCANTIKALELEPKQLIEGLDIVPSGVAEIARLQFHEGYAYIKP